MKNSIPAALVAQISAADWLACSPDVFANVQNPFRISQLRKQLTDLRNGLYAFQSCHDLPGAREVLPGRKGGDAEQALSLAILLCESAYAVECAKVCVVRAIRTKSEGESWSTYVALTREFSALFPTAEFTVDSDTGDRDPSPAELMAAALWQSWNCDPAGHSSDYAGQSFAGSMWTYVAGGCRVLRQSGGLDV